ncbi:peptidase M55 [Paenibacillus hemerocallicola]|uniref:Peptidase M55 n=1 Tax=Paenibacillus hemerocallicola TaxID=1172614 RepID=A0A5C4SXA4_9BACL|nr:M55 family metallopeptidase [Paenibacillus hemerocallicola]TNJ59876.1 peptidase M55 [Paenibacillus hemerocallicola]
MKFFILSDLEGVAGTDSFTQTRTSDPAMKESSMRQLAHEVNACAAGIRTVHPDAFIDVWDGHGNGGILPEELIGVNYIGRTPPSKPYYHLVGYAAMLFVGQHAMAGTIDAPLNHTYASKEVMYYRLNDVFIGEFGARALVAGMQAVPTIFLAGDDKATLEARMFVPEIETVATKQGTGVESAIHLDKGESCARIREGTIRAVHRLGEIPPFAAIRPPYRFEARHMVPFSPEWMAKRPQLTYRDQQTYTIETDDLSKLPF